MYMYMFGHIMVKTGPNMGQSEKGYNFMYVHVQYMCIHRVLYMYIHEIVIIVPTMYSNSM